MWRPDFVAKFVAKMHAKSMFCAPATRFKEQENVLLKTLETIDTQGKALQSIEIAGLSFWQGMRDSNP